MSGPFIFIATNRLRPGAYEQNAAAGPNSLTSSKLTTTLGGPGRMDKAIGRAGAPEPRFASSHAFACGQLRIGPAPGEDQREEATHADQAATWAHGVCLSAVKRQALRRPAERR